MRRPRGPRAGAGRRHREAVLVAVAVDVEADQSQALLGPFLVLREEARPVHVRPQAVAARARQVDTRVAVLVADVANVDVHQPEALAAPLLPLLAEAVPGRVDPQGVRARPRPPHARIAIGEEALVELGDRLPVGPGEARALADDDARSARHDRVLVVRRECAARIVHDRAVVIVVVVDGARHGLEVVRRIRLDVLPADVDERVPVRAGLFVVDADRVQDLVDDRADRGAGREADVLPPAAHAHGGRVAVCANELDGVGLIGPRNRRMGERSFRCVIAWFTRFGFCRLAWMVNGTTPFGPRNDELVGTPTPASTSSGSVSVSGGSSAWSGLARWTAWMSRSTAASASTSSTGPRSIQLSNTARPWMTPYWMGRWSTPGPVRSPLRTSVAVRSSP